MEQDTVDHGAAATDGTPNPSPVKSEQGSGKKTKKQKQPKTPQASPHMSASAVEATGAAAAAPTMPTNTQKQGENPVANKQQGSAKKSKAEKKAQGQGQGPEQSQGQKKGQGPPEQGQKKGQGASEQGQGQKKSQGQGPEQGQGQKKVQGPPEPGENGGGGAQGDAAPQKSKAELKAERRAIQEAQRAAKAQKKGEGAQEKPKADAAKRVPPKVMQDVPSMEKKEEKKLAKQHVPARSSTGRKVALFNHLRQPSCDVNHLMDLQVWNSGGDSTTSQGLHPAILRLGLKYNNYTVTGSDARAVGLLSAFDQAIADYQVPEKKEFSRDIDTHIKRYISFLDGARPLSVSMGNAIKYVKWKIFQLAKEPDMPEAEARDQLRKGIDKFLREKILSASDAIAIYGSELVASGDLVIVYSFSSVVYKVLKKAAKDKKQFKVFVIDNRPKYEGKEMLRRLRRLGIDCMFVPLNMAAVYIRAIKKGSTVGQIKGRDNFQGAQNCKVLIGAHGVFNNACVMSRVGTAMLGTIAKAHNIRVLVCFETYKISDRCQCDSFVFNELGNPNELVEVKYQDSVLTSSWQDLKSLSLLNLMYDVMPASCASTYVTEIRSFPATAIPKVMNSKVLLYET